MTVRFKLILGAMALTLSTPAMSQLTAFYDRSQFEAAAGPVTVETFNDFASQTSFGTVPLNVGDFALSVTPGAEAGERNSIDIPPLQFDVFNVDGTPIANVLTNQGLSFFLTFFSPVSAFGADFGNLNDGLLRTVVVVNGQTFTPLIDQSFFGFTSQTPFSSIEFRSAGGGDGFGLDNATFSSLQAAVPEPGTWAMMLLGFGGVGVALRRRRRSGTFAETA